MRTCSPSSRIAFLVAGVVAAGAAMAASGAEPAQLLRLRWEPGHRYTIETTTDSTTMLTAAGMKEDQKMKVRQTTTVDVTEAEGGSKAARVTFAAMNGELRIEGQTHAFDSADMAAAHPMIRHALGGSVGRSFVMKYSADDQFTGSEGTSSMVDPALGTPALTDIAQAAEVADLFRRSLEMGLPKTPVRPGDRWTAKETVAFPKAGAVQVELRARYEAAVAYEGLPHVKISFEGEMNQAAEQGTAPLSNADGSISLGAGSKISGQVLYDKERRMVSFAAFRADLTLVINGTSIPVRQQVTTKLASVTAL